MYKIDTKKITKMERIELLKLYDINALYYKLFKKKVDLKYIKKYIFKYKRISVRTQNPLGKLDLGYPKLINVNPKKNYNNIVNLLNSYDLLISEGIDPDDCIKCGNVALLFDKIIVEIVYGPGTLDRLTREGKVDQHWITTYNKYKDIIYDKAIVHLVRDLVKLPFREIIIEFSYYKKKYGILNKNYVAWEFINI